MFTKNNNLMNTLYLLKLLHLKTDAPILSTHDQLVNTYDLINKKNVPTIAFL